MELPRLYAIVDAGLVAGSLLEFTEELMAGGVRLIQYRNKKGTASRMLSDLREMRRICGGNVQLLVNDRSDLALAAGADGVHLGQDDISVQGSRRLCAAPKIVGVSAHDLEQIRIAENSDADYVAYGPVFPTRSKERPDPAVGLRGLEQACALTKKPLVAIGGITRSNCKSVMETGADSVAVISDLLSQPRESSAAFLEVLL
jgi:thiamine-phosphate pyrophosphorylase